MRSLIAVVLCLVSYFLLPSAGALLEDPNTPRNIDYVFGFDGEKPQEWMPPLAYLFVWMGALVGLVFIPTHLLLKKYLMVIGMRRKARMLRRGPMAIFNGAEKNGDFQ